MIILTASNECEEVVDWIDGGIIFSIHAITHWRFVSENGKGGKGENEGVCDRVYYLNSKGVRCKNLLGN